MWCNHYKIIIWSLLNGYLFSYTSYTNERAFNSFGGNLLLGADFFLVKNMYFGFELGLGYEMIKYKQVEYVISSDVRETETIPSSKSSDFGFFFNNSIRLGIWF